MFFTVSLWFCILENQDQNSPDDNLLKSLLA